MTALPVGLLNGIGVVGIVALLGWLLATGRLATRREVDAKDRQIEALMQRDVIKDQTISDFSKAISESNALTRAFLDVARDRRRDSSP